MTRNCSLQNILSYIVLSINKQNRKLLVLFRRVLNDFNSQSDYSYLTEDKY